MNIENKKRSVSEENRNKKRPLTKGGAKMKNKENYLTWSEAMAFFTHMHLTDNEMSCKQKGILTEKMIKKIKAQLKKEDALGIKRHSIKCIGEKVNFQMCANGNLPEDPTKYQHLGYPDNWDDFLAVVNGSCCKEV